MAISELSEPGGEPEHQGCSSLLALLAEHRRRLRLFSADAAAAPSQAAEHIQHTDVCFGINIISDVH